MKHLLFIGCLFTFLHSNAQEPGIFSINLYGGYTFRDRLKLDTYHVDVHSGFQYGAGLEYAIQYNNAIEMKYLRMNTSLPLYKPDGTQANTGFDQASLNYFLFGGHNYFGYDFSERIIPYVGGALGIGIADGERNTVTKFAWDLKLGVKFKTASAVSFNLQAYIQSIISTLGSDFWTTGGGSGINVPDYATIFQFGLGGVVSFDLKKK